MLTAILLTFFTSGAHAEDFHIKIGETIAVPASADEKIRLKGRGVIDAQDENSQLKIRGLQEGEAKISVGQKNYTIFVSAEKAPAKAPARNLFWSRLAHLLSERRGLRATASTRVEGQLHRLSDWQDIAELAEEHSAHYTFGAIVDEDIRSEVQAWILKKLTESGLPRPRIFWNPSVQIVAAEELRNLEYRFQKILAPLGLSVRFEKSEISIEPLVRVRILVAEINKAMQSQIGIEWPTQAEAQLLPKFSGPKQLSVFLKAVEQKGMGQILASPNLLARSGSEAEFLAGGEFPVIIITAQRREVTWKRHGIFLKIKPRADRSGRMSIELSTEVSLVDMAQAVDGVPGLKTNRMSTHFDLSSSQTIVLSGLIRNDWGESSQGVPGLSRLPILGGLFRSEGFQNHKTELVIFVTPEIVPEDATGDSQNE